MRMREIKRRLGCVALAALAAALLTSSTLASAADDNQWTLQALPTANVAPNGQLTGISCVSAAACVAVGVAQDGAGREAALAEVGIGARWDGQSMPGPDGVLGTTFTAVSCTDIHACTAVGNYLNDANQHLSLAERWDGNGWQVQSTAPRAASGDSYFSGVSCPSTTVCMAVGYVRNSAGQKSPLAERWNGRTWDIQPTPANVGNADSVLSGVSCTSASACTAVGKTGVSFLLSTALVERWNGVTWQAQSAASPTGASGTTLSAVSCSTATACTAVGSYTAGSTKAGGVLAEAWDGTNWTVQSTPGATLDVLTSVSCTNPTACTAVGQSGFSAALVDHWDGATWTTETTPMPPGGATQTSLLGVSCASTASCTSVGSDFYASGGGTYLTLVERSIGTHWDIQKSFNPRGATRNGLVGVSCATARDCTAVGYSFDSTGTRVPLAEGWDGARWSILSAATPPGATDSGLSGVSCSTPRDCTAVGSFADASGAQVTLAEHWNGANWRIQPSPAPVGATASVLNAVSCTSSSDHRTLCTAAGGFSGVDGVVQTLTERWNGANWEVQSTPNPSGAAYVAFQGVSCPTARDCTAVGLHIDAAFNFLTFAEHWDGTTWQIQSSPNPVGTDGANGTFEGGVSCSTARACTAVGQFSPSPAPHPGVTLAERWNGVSWTIQPTPNPAPVEGMDGTRNDPFAAVSCASANSCTAVGNYAAANGDFPTMAEHWNGTSWSVQAAATPSGAYYSSLVGVACPEPDTCVAVGQSSRYNVATANQEPTGALAERYGSGRGDRQ